MKGGFDDNERSKLGYLQSLLADCKGGHSEPPCLYQLVKYLIHSKHCGNCELSRTAYVNMKICTDDIRNIVRVLCFFAVHDLKLDLNITGIIP